MYRSHRTHTGRSKAPLFEITTAGVVPYPIVRDSGCLAEQPTKPVQNQRERLRPTAQGVAGRHDPTSMP
jgi:hypothetical protein